MRNSGELLGPSGADETWNNSKSDFTAVLVVGAVFSLYWTYFASDSPLIGAQPGFVVIPYLFVGLAFLVWLRAPRRRAAGFLAAFLLLWFVAWLYEVALTLVRGEAYNLAVFLIPVVLIGIFTKKPSKKQVLGALSILGWMLAGVLVATRLGEILGFLELPYVNPSLISFDTANYWLPLSGYFGLEGRWMGPFGHSAETGFAGALLIVLGALRWKTLQSSVFLAVGALTLLSVGTRSAYTAALGALLVAAVVTNRGPLSRIPYKVRVGGASVLALLAIIGLFLSRAGLTGRDEIWADYLVLAGDSPLIGVGTSGIAQAPGWPGVSFHAHNIFIDELARYGAVGLVLLLVILGLLAWRGYVAAREGNTLGIGIVSAFIIAGLTNSDHSFLGVGYVNLTLLLVAVLVIPDTTRTEIRTSRTAQSA
jgi:hypothetical protein